MVEFVLRRRDDDWIQCPSGTAASEWFVPLGIGAQPCEGWGNFRMKVGDTEMAFSDEGSFIHICFEGSELDDGSARAIMQRIRDRYQEKEGVEVYFNEI